MKSIIWTAITLLTAISISSTCASDVLYLNSTKEFENAIQQNDLVLLKFFVPWCPHSKALEPEYEKAATILRPDNVTLSEIDCSINQDICTRYNVQGYPTLQVFRKGHPSDIYPFERNSDNIVEYMRSHLSNGLIYLKTKEELESLKKNESLVVIAYLTENDTSNIEKWKTFSADLIDDFAFGIVTDKVLIDAEEIQSFPSIVLYKRFDNLRDVYRGEIIADQVEDFIKLNSVPLLSSIDPSNFMDYVDAGRPLVYIFSNSEEMHNEMHDLFFPLAKKYKGIFSFVYIDARQYASQAEFLSLTGNKWPALAVHNFKTGARYPYDESKDLKENDIIQFLESVRKGQGKPALKSQAYPIRKPDDVVKVVVGNDFEDIVMDKSKDVLLEIYAPWCRYCQALAPIYQQLGEIMQSYNAEKEHDIVIAKMDGTLNDVPLSAGFSIKAYPTIKFFKANTNEIIDYDGERTLHDLVNFLNLYSTKQTLKIDLESLLSQPSNIDKETYSSVIQHDEF
ncbi:thioredoxin-like protein [Cokeromyces recurvatus]|uniref:thioredoxin-like protein n=1 Tax=Cokeromyces recurvatus TaxID=90255 RepID=UPI0022203D59|nr:thioredoxin-like protein [Cokeromyces recurvatus]KAI7906684.1 thioredoxin-like protein [Cokeromyces recurvatus]